MRKNVIAAIAGAMALCMMAAGCAGTQTGTAADPGTADTAAAAATEAPAAATEEAAAAAETAETAEAQWRDQDDAYLSGIDAENMVELPEKYDKIRVEVAKRKEVTDEQVEENIQNTLLANAPLKEVDRKVKEGDTVSIDFTGKLDGEEFEGGSGSYDLVIGSHTFIEGFEEGLIGAKKGETRDLELTFPENYSAAELAGKEVVFTVTVNKISEYDVPKLDDDYVRSLNRKDKFNNAITSVEEYRDYVRANLDEQNESDYRNAVIAACQDKLLQESTFNGEAPADMIDQYNDSMTRMLQYYALMNYTELKDLMINVYHATEDNYMEMIGDMAETQMKRDIILQAIADKKDLNPDEEDVEKAIADYVESEDTIESADDIGRYAKEFLRDELMRNNVYDWLVEHCKVEELPEVEKEADEAEASSDTAATDTAADEADTSKTAEESSEDKDSEDKDSEDKDSEDKDSEDKDSEDKEDSDKEESR